MGPARCHRAKVTSLNRDASSAVGECGAGVQMDGGTDVPTELSYGSCAVKIVDFGLSVRLALDSGAGGHVSNVSYGTPAYTSPEVKAQHRLKKASDVFAFGVMLWEV